MTLEARVVALAQAIGTDVKTLTTAVGSLGSLTTTAKSSLVAAINEIAQAAASATGIDDGVTSGASTWSSTKISSEISGAVSGLVDGAGAALDTLKELAAALGNDPSFATTIATQIANRVRYDEAQTLTSPQQAQARANIGAAAASDVATLTTGLGTYDRDYVADYTTAKA